MATYDRNLGVWRASDGSSGFASQAEAEAYEDSGTRAPTNDTGSYQGLYTNLVRPTDAAQAEQATIKQQADTQRASDAQTVQRSAYFKGNGQSFGENVAGGGYQDGKGFVDAPTKTWGEQFADLGRLSAYTAGAAVNPVGFIAGDYLGDGAQAVINPVGYASQKGIEQAAGFLPGGSGTGVNHNNMGDAGPGIDPGTDAIRTPGRNNGATVPLPGGGTQAPASTPEQNVAADRAGRDADKTSLTDMYEDARYNGSPEADESRRNQQAALSKQAELYSVLANFDPDAYAKKASDLAMSNELALARSQVGAAAGAEGLFQAGEQAPKIQADARRDADAQLLQKQQLAAQVTGQMGDLAGATRQQDIGEAELKSDFGLKIADGVSQITGLDWQLDSKESESLANISLALDKENIDWARLDLDSQIAEADRILSEAGLAQQWRIFKAGQSLSEKDLYGGLLTLLGTGMTGAFGIAAAKAGK